MVISDLYNNGVVLGTNMHPKGFSQAGRTSYMLTVDAGDTIILDVQSLNAMTLQSSSSNTFEVLVSNYPYREVNTAKNNTYKYTNNNAGIAPDTYIYPNSTAVFTSYGMNTVAFVSLNIASITQVKLVFSASQTIHIQCTDKHIDTVGLSNVPSNTSSTPSIDTSMMLGVDENGNEIIRVIQYDSTGAQVSVAWIDPNTGLITTAPASFLPNNDYEYITDTACFDAINTGVGYAVGDKLQEYTTITYLNGTVINTNIFWKNGNNIITTPLSSDIQPCNDSILLEEIRDNQQTQITQLTAINNNSVITNTTLATIDGTLANINSNTQGVITAINNLDSSLSTEIQDATAAINTQNIASTTAIINAINSDLDYVPTDTTTYWQAINTGTGYAIGDTIKEETTKKYEDNVLISTTTVYTNMSTNTVITPLINDLGAVGGNTTTSQDNIVKLYDILPSGECIPFYAVVNSDGMGNYVSYTPIIYTPTGSVEIDPRWTNMGYESINIDDTAVYTLTVPAGCNHADVNFIGTNTPLQPIVDYAWYQYNSAGPAPTTTSGYKSLLSGQEIDLQGADEVNAFQIICGSGMSGRVNVIYKYNPNMQN